MPASDVYTWAKASVKPSYTATEVGLGSVNNTADSVKSVSYAASSGAVAWSGISSKPTTLSGYSISDWAYGNYATGLDTMTGTSGCYYFSANSPISGQSDGTVWHHAYPGAPTTWGSQLVQDYRTGRTWIRGRNNGAWSAWLGVIDSGNIGAQSVSNSITVASLAVASGRNNAANQVVRTDANGYLQTGYINSSNGDENNNSNADRVWGTNGSDNYLRTYRTSALSVSYAATAGSAPANGGTSAACSGNAATATKANGAINWWSTSHPVDYYMVVNWDGTYWSCTSNHGSPVKVGYATSAGSAPANGGTSAACSGNAASATVANHLTGASAYTNGSDGWWRTDGAAGWYNASYSVGIYATEAGNVRTYNGSNFIAAGNVTAYSDERLKTNWRDMPEDFVERLSEVKNGTYDRTDNCAAKTQDGVSAQSLQPLMPNSILTDSDGMLSIAYGSAAMVSAVQLAKRVVEQDARIARLESLIETLMHKE